MTNEKHHFEIDTDRGQEMFRIKLDGDVIFEGNFWDFSRARDLPHILSKVADVTEGEYTYE